MVRAPVRPAGLLLLLSTLVPRAWARLRPLPLVAAGDGPKLGAVACEVGTCSKIGTQLLLEGGSAVDAIVGTVICVGTVAMYHSGIGGGGFALLRTSNGSYESVDFRETAPAAAYEDMFKDNADDSIFGGLASGVPGELRGLEYLHKKYGKLPWARTIAPSVALARFGFTVNEDHVFNFHKAAPNDFLTDDPAWAEDFAPNGTLVGLGDTMTRKRYASMLEDIANIGVDAFYKGTKAEAMIRALQGRNGTMTLDDLAGYSVVHRPPMRINYRGYTLTTTNAPSSGVVALSALNTVSGYDGFGDPASINLTTHRLDEAIRFAYGQRTEMGDPSFVPHMDNYTANMITPARGAQIRSRISDFQTQSVDYYDPNGLESKDTHGTSHMVAADASGMTVSLTTTINLVFGSRLMVPETGVIMNNEMNDFSIPGVNNSFGYIPSPSNYVRPGKRPLSSMSPIIGERDGRVCLAVGAAGGSRITTATIQNVHHVVDQNMAIAEALAEPRLHDQLSPDQVSFEWQYDNATTAYMAALGHKVVWVAPNQSNAQGLRILPNGTFEAAGEPRQKASGGYAV